MAKVFTIAEGLENMGALKSGGQGSVYKGRRIGELISAVKILPTPLHSESADDKNYVVFQNEVQKLKKVNEQPNPHIASILNSGITESGNFPFIEMEYIEGPDLSDLLKPPHEPVFTIRETIKVAQQLSDALAHCHKLGVRHGDLKSNNVKYNVKTGNYVLLDFGMAMMSDEQRRTSLRHAGAIEFMAPEQNEGVMLFETDVYSFGVILFELLAGNVPFPLKDNGETARNTVMMAHLDTPPPDLLTIRRNALPAGWSPAKQEQELLVPNWLLKMIYRCLEKSPQNRYHSGIELNDEVIRNSISSELQPGVATRYAELQQEINQLREENARLVKQLGISPGIVNTGKVVAGTVKQRSNPSTGRRAVMWTAGIAAVLAAVYFLLPPGIIPVRRATNREHEQPARVAGRPRELDDTSILRLNEARVYMANRLYPRAAAIYKGLSQQRVPEGMYQYATLALKNRNPDLSCQEAFDLLLQTGELGYAPAKRTAGFLFSYADDAALLKQVGYYERCVLPKDAARGSKLLTEAMIQGDTVALRLVNDLNKANRRP